MELKGKVALVVGGSQGAGRAYVLALARAGAVVAAAARTPGPLADVVREAETEGHRVLAVACDIEREQDVERMIEQVIGRFGQLDVLVNNAATYTHHDPLAMGVEDWDRTMRINVRGVWLAIRHAAPHMMRKGGGSIINLTSRAAQTSERGTMGHVDLCVYAVSKAAVDRMTSYFAEELKPHGIAVNAISPGAALTETWKRIDPAAYEAVRQSGQGNEATPEVLGPPIVFLAAQTAATLTGKILHTNSFRKTWP